MAKRKARKKKTAAKYDRFTVARAVKALERLQKLILRKGRDPKTAASMLAACGQINRGLRSKLS